MVAQESWFMDGTLGDLFDFDYEVEPILEVLVGKVLEQGLMEVMEEEELSAMKAHQEHIQQVRNAELVATQRMETAEIRKQEEKDRRIAQVEAAQMQIKCFNASIQLSLAGWTTTQCVTCPLL